MSMVMEFMQLGDLFRLLQDKETLPESAFTWRLKLLIALDVSRAMEALHSVPIVHKGL